jgi:hypothetical protein
VEDSLHKKGNCPPVNKEAEVLQENLSQKLLMHKGFFHCNLPSLSLSTFFGGVLHILEGWEIVNGFARSYTASTYPGSYQVEKL